MAFSEPYKHQPSAIVSFNFTDVASGTGVVKFYGYSVYSTSETYQLGTAQIFSNTIEHAAVSKIGGVTFTKGIDIDFDLTAFNSPSILRGTALVNFTYRLNTTDPVSADARAYPVVNISKWDGTTETILVSGQGETITLAAAQTNYKIANVDLLIPKTQFKKGETLRVTVEIWYRTKTGENANITFGFDPQNRDGTLIIPSTDDPASTTKMEAYIPFDIDI